MSKLFIVFEGIDLTLKSTVIKTLKNNDLLHDMIEFTREPFDKNKIKKSLEKYNEIEAFAIDRKENYNKITKSKLNYIISDRSYISSMVYQSNNEISSEKILKKNLSIVPMISKQKIDYVFYFTSTYDEYLKRLNSRGNNDEKDYYTKEEYEKMQEKYISTFDIVVNNNLISEDIFVFDSTSSTFIEDVVNKIKLVIERNIRSKWNW